MADISPNGKNFKILGEDHDPCISPDGKKIAFTDSDGKGWCVFICDASGSNRRQITYGTNQMGAVFTNWSPGGKKLFMRISQARHWNSLFVAPMEETCDS